MLFIQHKTKVLSCPLGQSQYVKPAKRQVHLTAFSNFHSSLVIPSGLHQSWHTAELPTVPDCVIMPFNAQKFGAFSTLQ